MGKKLEVAVKQNFKKLRKEKNKTFELANLAAEQNFKRLRKEIAAEQKFRRLSKKKK